MTCQTTDRLRKLTDQQLIEEARKMAKMVPMFAPWFLRLAHRLEHRVNTINKYIKGQHD